MKKVIIEEKQKETINLSDISNDVFIIAKREGKISGFMIKECGGWILKVNAIGGGCCGHLSSREKCMKRAGEFGHEFFIED